MGVVIAATEASSGWCRRSASPRLSERDHCGDLRRCRRSHQEREGQHDERADPTDQPESGGEAVGRAGVEDQRRGPARENPAAEHHGVGGPVVDHRQCEQRGHQRRAGHAPCPSRGHLRAVRAQAAGAQHGRAGQRGRAGQGAKTGDGWFVCHRRDRRHREPDRQGVAVLTTRQHEHRGQCGKGERGGHRRSGRLCDARDHRGGDPEGCRYPTRAEQKSQRRLQVIVARAGGCRRPPRPQWRGGPWPEALHRGEAPHCRERNAARPTQQSRARPLRRRQPPLPPRRRIVTAREGNRRHRGTTPRPRRRRRAEPGRVDRGRRSVGGPATWRPSRA